MVNGQYLHSSPLPWHTNQITIPISVALSHTHTHTHTHTRTHTHTHTHTVVTELPLHFCPKTIRHVEMKSWGLNCQPEVSETPVLPLLAHLHSTPPDVKTDLNQLTTAGDRSVFGVTHSPSAYWFYITNLQLTGCRWCLCDVSESSRMSK